MALVRSSLKGLGEGCHMRGFIFIRDSIDSLYTPSLLVFVLYGSIVPEKFSLKKTFKSLCAFCSLFQLRLPRPALGKSLRGCIERDELCAQRLWNINCIGL